MAEERVIRSIISAEEVASLARWQPPVMEEDAVNAGEVDERRQARGLTERGSGPIMPVTPPPPAVEELEPEQAPVVTAEELALIRKAAYDEGYAEGLEQGRRDGRKQGEAEGERLSRQWRSLVDALAEPLKDQEQAVEQELLRLAIALASQLVRREIRLDPGQIIAVIREAMGYLPYSRQSVRVSLHPEDARFVRETFHSDNNDERNWQIVEDPTMTRGGCRLATETSNLDATLESRLAALVAELLGGERDGD